MKYKIKEFLNNNPNAVIEVDNDSYGIYSYEYFYNNNEAAPKMRVCCSEDYDKISLMQALAELNDLNVTIQQC